MKYVVPEIKIVLFEAEDVIAASGQTSEEIPNPFAAQSLFEEGDTKF